MLDGATSYHLKSINPNVVSILPQQFLCASYTLLTYNKIGIMSRDFFSSLLSSVSTLPTKELKAPRFEPLEFIQVHKPTGPRCPATNKFFTQKGLS